MTAKKHFLADVCIIRIVLIVILVMYHAFCPFVGVWDSPENFPWVLPYYLWGKMLISLMLEMFVFISGLVFGLKMKRDGVQNVCNKGLITKRFQRLILPAIFFGALYVVLFYDFMAEPGEAALNFLEGAGHLWFLPMLFFCFVILAVLERCNCNRKVVLFIAICFSVFYVFGHLWSKVTYYFTFFLIGIYIGDSDFSVKPYAKLRNILLFLVIYLILFAIKIKPTIVFGGWYMQIMDAPEGTFDNITMLMLRNAMSLLTSLAGLAFFYLLINWFIDKVNLKVTDRMMRVSGYCFGVYIYQEFILKLLYYNLGVLNTCPPLLTPWLGFAVALPISVLLTHFTLKTRFGRYLIG